MPLSPCPRPLAHLSSVLSAPDPNTDTRGDSYQPPLLICLVSTRHQKFRLCRFVPQGPLRQKTPPGSSFSAKIFKPKSGLGSGRRWPGAVPASGRCWAGAGGPRPCSRVTPAPFLGVSVCEPWWGCSGPQRRRFVVPGGGLGRIPWCRCPQRASSPRRRATAPRADFFMPAASGISPIRKGSDIRRIGINSRKGV